MMTSSAPSFLPSAILPGEVVKRIDFRSHGVGEFYSHMTETAEADDAYGFARTGMPMAER